MDPRPAPGHWVSGSVQATPWQFQQATAGCTPVISGDDCPARRVWAESSILPIFLGVDILDPSPNGNLGQQNVRKNTHFMHTSFQPPSQSHLWSLQDLVRKRINTSVVSNWELLVMSYGAVDWQSWFYRFYSYSILFLSVLSTCSTNSPIYKPINLSIHLINQI